MGPNSPEATLSLAGRPKRELRVDLRSICRAALGSNPTAGLDAEEAQEYCSYKIACAYTAEHTPVFLEDDQD